MSVSWLSAGIPRCQQQVPSTPSVSIPSTISMLTIPGASPLGFFHENAKGAYYLIVIMLTIACQQRWFLKQQLTFSERERR
jgi:hypothetical protein